MISEASTMLDVAKKKSSTDSPPPEEPKERPGYPVFARIDDDLGEALEAYIKNKRPKPAKTAIIETALEDFLTKEGFWPPQAEKE